MNDDLDPQDLAKIEALIADLKILRKSPCSVCHIAICGHEALMSLTMGFKNDPQCWTCLSTTLEYEKQALRDHVFAYIQHRPCHYEGWKWAGREEGFEENARPGCLWPAQLVDRAEAMKLSPHSVLDAKLVADADFDSEWDAGGIGCGDLVLELRLRLQVLKPGRVLKLIATDAGAQEDLPAWCRMTGNPLIAFHHPVYLIQRKMA